MTTVESPLRPVVSGPPLWILRAEGVVMLAAALAAFANALDEPWWLMPLLLLFPDLRAARE